MMININYSCTILVSGWVMTCGSYHQNLNYFIGLHRIFCSMIALSSVNHSSCQYKGVGHREVEAIKKEKYIYLSC